ncbi:MAG: hypothetical protein LBL35_04480 [Clostridiales bacterium]|nr:hypothetical protein [Clostridiales bacterium]
MKKALAMLMSAFLILSMASVAQAQEPIVPEEIRADYESLPTTGDETLLPGFEGKLEGSVWTSQVQGVSVDYGADHVVIMFGVSFDYAKTPIDRIVVKGEEYWKTLYFSQEIVTGNYLTPTIEGLVEEPSIKSVSFYTSSEPKDYGSITANLIMQDKAGNDLDVEDFTAALGKTPQAMFQVAYTVNGTPITINHPFLFDSSDTVMEFKYLYLDTEYTVSEMLDAQLDETAAVLTEPQVVTLTAGNPFADFEFINKIGGLTLLSANTAATGSVTIQTSVKNEASEPVTPPGGDQIAFTLTYAAPGAVDPVSVTKSCKPGESVVFSDLPLNVDLIAAPSNLPDGYTAVTTPFIQALTPQQPYVNYAYNFTYKTGASASSGQSVGDPIAGVQSLLDSLPKAIDATPPVTSQPAANQPAANSNATKTTSSAASSSKGNPLTGDNQFKEVILGLAAIGYAFVIGAVIQKKIKKAKGQ